VRVIPRARKAGIHGVRSGHLVIRVTAPPVDRAANEAVVGVLAEVLAVPRRAIRIVSGETARNKTIDVDALTPSAVIAAIGRLAATE
jgi:uncharacterized protein (TIGR00251 family)